MTTTEIRRELKRRVSYLPADRLPLAGELIAYLEEQESIAATQELLDIPGFLEAFRAAKKQARRGRLTPLEEIRWKN
ncbi:MAG: hypothetical protein FJ291_24885 [Planctomycetes bacterium]|nr:hypothetical protein [Planctomycetota bacterium]